MQPPIWSKQQQSESGDDASRDIELHQPSCLDENIECIKCDGQGMVNLEQCAGCGGYGHELCNQCRAYSDQLAARSNAALSIDK